MAGADITGIIRGILDCLSFSVELILPEYRAIGGQMVLY